MQTETCLSLSPVTACSTQNAKGSQLCPYKGKSVPLQARSSHRVSGRFPDFMTTAQDGGKVFSLTHRPLLLPGNAPGTHFC